MKRAAPLQGAGEIAGARQYSFRHRVVTPFDVKALMSTA